MYCIMRIEKRKRQDIGGLQKEATRTATESQIRGDIERQQRIAGQLAEMNQRARREFAQTKKQTEQMQKQVELVKNFLTIAEQRQLDELYKGNELER